MDKVITEIKRVNFSDLPKNAIDSAKRSILDTLGVLIKGTTYPNMIAVSKLINPSNKQELQSEILLKNTEVSDIAMYYGTAAHSVELDDFYREGSVHPGVVVVPTAFACAQELAIKGTDFLKSIIIGYETMGRIGMSANGTLYNRGFHPTSVCGVYGSASTSSYLYALTEEETKMALGIAGNFSFGLMAYKSNGAWTKRLNAGWAAKSGIIASKLALHGFVGPDDILKGRYGFAQAFSEEFNEEVLDSPITDNYVIEEISFKPYSSCRFTHSPIDAVIQLIQRHDIDIETIERVEVFTHKTGIEATAKPEDRKYRPATTVDAQFSIPYCLGLAVYYQEVSPEMFELDRLQDPKILNIADKVIAYEDEECTREFPRHNSCKVIIHTKEQIYENNVKDSKGDPEVPLTNEEMTNKFRRLTSNIISEINQEKIIESVWGIENLEDIRDITKLL